MIGRVKTNLRCHGLPATHNSFAASACNTRSSHGVFEVITTGTLRKNPLAIEKHDTVFFLRKRTTLVNELVSFNSLLGQRRKRHTGKVVCRKVEICALAGPTTGTHHGK